MLIFLALTLALGNETAIRITPVAHPTFSRAAAVERGVFAWSDGRGIVVAHEWQGATAVISPSGVDPDLAGGRDGYLLAWSDNGSLFAIRLNVHGDAIGAPTQLNAGTGVPHVIFSGGDYHILFGEHVFRVPATGALSATVEIAPHGPWSAMARRNESFALAGSVNDTTHGWCSLCVIPRYTVTSWFGAGTPVPDETWYEQSRIPPSIACNGTRCLTAWYDTLDGIAILRGNGDKFFLHTFNTPQQAADQTGPIAIAPYGDDFILVWQERTAFGDSDVLAAIVRYDDPQSELRFTIASTPRNERRPALGTLADGRIVIAYEVVDTDGSLYLVTRPLGAPARRRTS